MENIQSFVEEVSEIVGQHIDTNNVTPSEGREYYIQPPKERCPMLLHHYNGSFVIDLHQKDYEALKDAKILSHEYIVSANWQVGYYWSIGNSMIRGGYYQPMSLYNRDLRRYLKTLSCRGAYEKRGYRMASHQQCSICSLESCSCSRYKWGPATIEEIDPRQDFLSALRIRFREEYSWEYMLERFYCSSRVPDEEVWLEPIPHYEGHDYGFSVWASESLIRSLLMRETEAEQWAKKVVFKIHVNVNDVILKEAFRGIDYAVVDANEAN